MSNLIPEQFGKRWEWDWPAKGFLHDKERQCYIDLKDTEFESLDELRGWAIFPEVLALRMVTWDWKADETLIEKQK